MGKNKTSIGFKNKNNKCKHKQVRVRGFYPKVTSPGMHMCTLTRTYTRMPTHTQGVASIPKQQLLAFTRVHLPTKGVLNVTLTVYALSRSKPR